MQEVNPWVWKIPWSRKWHPTPVFLPGKFRGQRSLAAYSPRGCKELDMTEWLSTHTHKSPTLESSSYKLSERECSVNIRHEWNCPFSPTADDPSALPPPTFSPSYGHYLFLLIHLMPASVCQLLYCTTALFEVLYCKINNVLFFVFMYSLY